MIRTVTLNTGFDEVFTVSGVSFGGVEAVIEHAEVASGKGVNAARTARALGQPVVAYGLVGAADRGRFEAGLLAGGVTPVLVDVPGPTRRNLTLRLAGDERPAAHFRAGGFDLAGSPALARLGDAVAADVEPGDVVTLHGSTPRGAPDSAWAALAGAALRAGARLVVDVYGPGLPLVLDAAGPGILVCKPNGDEIQALPGGAGGAGGAGAAAARRAALRHMAGRGVRLPAVTLGADGVVFAEDGAIWSARCPVEAARVQVGAGDAFTGAVAAGLAAGLDPGRDLVALATAVAAAHVAAVPAERLAREGPGLRDRVVIELEPER